MAIVPIIGVDLGNFFLQPCFIQGMDPVTRRGGILYDLVDPSSNMLYGIPTAFAYSKSRGIVCGIQATRMPSCVRYLKRDLFKNGKPNSKTIDGRTFTYDEMILEVAQHGIRMAVKQLEMQLHIKTNKVALSYPASMSSFVKNHLVSLIEKVTLEDGTKIEIVGTIAEPAAAALDYLASANITKDTTALVADLGAGTFDVSVVKVYPSGRKYTNGSVYYYDVKFSDGIEDLGGKEFDQVIQNINKRNAGSDALDPGTLELIRSSAESLKRDLSFETFVQPMIFLKNGNMIAEITREEFEKESAHHVEKMLKMVEDTINANSDVTIDYIVLTGGASQMPMIERMFKERFPKFKDKICFHMPSKAIASGAARFGVKEGASSDVIGNKTKSTVVIRTIRDIGSDFYDDQNDKKGHITTYIKAGTPIPCKSEWINAYKLKASQYTRFGIYEAKTSSPNEKEIQRDYQLVHNHRHDHGVERPIDFQTQSRIVIDDKHLAYLEVREPTNPSKPIVKYPFTIDFQNGEK